MTHDEHKEECYRVYRHALYVSGELVRPSTCSQCKTTGTIENPIEGHHVDYDKPLEVIWYCKSCHGRISLSLTGKKLHKDWCKHIGEAMKKVNTGRKYSRERVGKALAVRKRNRALKQGVAA
jgi:hypothetical protein